MVLKSDDLSSYVAPIDAPLSLSELRNRSGFRAPLNPKEHRLAEVLTEYHFADEAPCGLATCKQGHLHGLLVRTDAGLETNLGHVCGKRHFPEYDSLHSKFKRLQRRKNVLSRISMLRQQRPVIDAAIKDLIERPFGIKWAFALRDAIKEHAGFDIYRDLGHRAQRGDLKVTRVKELSGAELDKAARDSGRKKDEVRYVTEQIGVLAPLTWLAWDFRQELVLDIKGPLAELDSLHVETLDTRLLEKAIKKLSGWETKLEAAETVLKQAPLFLAPKNISVVREMIEEFYRHKPRAEEINKNGKKKQDSGPSYFENWERTPQYQSLVAGRT